LADYRTQGYRGRFHWALREVVAELCTRPLAVFIPAIVAGLTDVLVAVLAYSNQPNYPFRVGILQIAVLGLALLMATPVWPLR
jgi:hypothetical protein